MDVLVGRATRSVLIIGVNLEGAVARLTQIIELVCSGGTVRLLAMDPRGDALIPSAMTAGADPQIRRQKIIQNLGLLHGQFAARLSEAELGRVSLHVPDRVFPVGATGIDTETHSGSHIVQHYLTDTPAERSPLIQLRRTADQPWYDRYLAQ